MHTKALITIDKIEEMISLIWQNCMEFLQKL